MRRPLLDEELAALAGAAGASGGQADPWNLTSRRVHDLEFADRSLPPSVWTDIECRGVSLARISWRGPRFVQVDFEGLELRDCHLQDAAFDQCTFNSLACTKARLHRVSFTNCTFVAPTFSECDLREVTLLNTTIRAPLFEDTDLAGVTCTNSTLEKATVEGGTWENIKIVRGAVRGLRGTEVRVGEMTIDRTELQLVEFSLGSIGRLNLEAARGGPLALADLNCEELALARSPSFSDLTAIGVTFKRFTVLDNPGVINFLLYRCTLKEFLISNSSCRYSGIDNCQVTELASVVGSLLDGFILSESTLDGLAVRDSTFASYLKIPASRFVGLRLANNRWSEGLRVLSDGTTYTGSDEFPLSR